MGLFSGSYLPVVQAKRAERTKAIEAVKALVSPAEGKDLDLGDSEILRATAVEIAKKIESEVWTAIQVVDAFIRRAILAHERTNCLTEVLFSQARERAKQLDDEFAVTKKLKGPLHGVPVSVKDQFDIESVDTSIGFTTWAHKPAIKNAELVQHLLDAGAVIISKTNIPQTLFAFESNNPLWGRTLNPWNGDYTSGGSSGGEAALLAMDGSALGIGTDIGGSLRIPTAYCGIYALKPGFGRISFAGARSPSPGNEGIRNVAGPMGRSIEDLELVSRLAFGIQRENLEVPPLHFREVTLPSKLRFGYYTSDGFVKASPACKRAVLETVKALEKQGHECIEIELPSVIDAFSVFAGIAAGDGYKTMLSHLGPDPKDSSLFLATLGPRLPTLIRKLASWAVKALVGDATFGYLMGESRPRAVEEVYELVNKRNRIAKEWSVKVWERYSLDAIIAPVQALPQVPHGGCDQFSPLAVGTFLYNVIDYPVGCVPVTRIDPSKDQLTDEWKDTPAPRSLLLERGLYHNKKALYNPVKSKGMPVAVQVVGRRWEEEKVLAMMKVVDAALGPRDFGPGSWDKFCKVEANGDGSS
ncbi:hypothetical protein AX16_001460 [Volvariella volvacea WC 439]|nr:hypothetical protein AX16_001460 [Volvariella volvacea WC 439]